MRRYLHSGDIAFRFKQTKEDFFVEELPLREFAQKGKYVIAKVKKTEMTTWDAVATLSKYLNLQSGDIGYAGLKDKHATTIQYFSFDARYISALKKFRHKNLEILDLVKDTKSIRMGDLSANRFVINLYEMDNIKTGRVEKIAKKILKEGLANYFGYQRFGRDKDALDQAREMLAGERFIKDTKVRNFLISVYQSHLFNEWLKKRIELSSDGKFKLLRGDVYMDEREKLFTPKEPPLADFLQKKVLPTGLLCGRGAFRARFEAREIEKEFDDEYLPYKGYRRAAIVFPKEFGVTLHAKKEMTTLRFALPKGAYATSFVEALRGQEIEPVS